MAAYTASGYAVADIAALKAIAPADRPASGSGIYALAYVSDIQWYEFDPDASTGGITPNSGTGRWFAIGREVLRANRTYYVRTDGSDSNDGLTNTSGGAFLTISKFFNVLATIDKNGFTVTCKIADGTYTLTTPINVTGGVGDGAVIVEGNTTTPASVLITSSQQISYFAKTDPSITYIKGIKFTNTANPSILVAFVDCTNGIVAVSDVDFGAAGSSTANGIHMTATASGVIYLLGNYTISGSAAIHIAALAGGLVRDWVALNPSGSATTVTLTGTPAFSVAFAFARGISMIDIFYSRINFSGSATGTRYSVAANAVIATFGGGTNYFPGSIAGTTATGGEYIA